MSAGNNQDPFAIDAYSDAHSFETADAIERQIALLTALDKSKASRGMLSHAESINGLTVGVDRGDGSSAVPAGVGKPLIWLLGCQTLKLDRRHGGEARVRTCRY